MGARHAEKNALALVGMCQFFSSGQVGIHWSWNHSEIECNFYGQSERSQCISVAMRQKFQAAARNLQPHWPLTVTHSVGLWPQQLVALLFRRQVSSEAPFLQQPHHFLRERETLLQASLSKGLAPSTSQESSGHKWAIMRMHFVSCHLGSAFSSRPITRGKRSTGSAPWCTHRWCLVCDRMDRQGDPNSTLLKCIKNSA